MYVTRSQIAIRSSPEREPDVTEKGLSAFSQISPSYMPRLIQKQRKERELSNGKKGDLQDNGAVAFANGHRSKGVHAKDDNDDRA